MAAALRNALLLYLAVMNLVAFLTFGTDKGRAKKGAWRVRERTLFLLALLGGSIGAIAGMYFFHHKTKHWYFRFGLPAILLVQIAAAVFLLRKLAGE